jgi:hypothetical protein
LVNFMSRYSAEERERILAGVCATLQRGEPQREQPPTHVRDDEWRLPEPEPPTPPRGLDTAPIDWDARIAEAVSAEHAFMVEVIAGTIAELREQIETNVRKEFEAALRTARIDAADAKIRCAELRISFTELRDQLSAAGHSKIVDLPNPLRRVN